MSCHSQSAIRNEAADARRWTQQYPRLSAFICGSILLSSICLFAQTAPYSGEPLSQAPAFKYYAWGQVHAPGAYRLSANPDIVELLSAAGGPTDQADVSNVVLVRGSDQRRVKVNLKEQLNSGKPLMLSPGDVIIVPRSLWYTIRDELAIVTSLAVFANLALTIINGVGR